MGQVGTRSVWLMVGAAAIVGAASWGCTPTREVHRGDPRDAVDLSYRFSDDDAREVAETMIDDALRAGWIEGWRDEHSGKRPVVIVGTVRNDTSEYIDSLLFTKQFERALVNSGRVRVVAMRTERGEVRDERAEIAEWSRPETVKKMAYELGADLMLIGRIGENVQISRGGNVRVQYYQVNLEMVDIESNEKVWIGERQIEKRQIDRN